MVEDMENSHQFVLKLFEPIKAITAGRRKILNNSVLEIRCIVDARGIRSLRGIAFCGVTLASSVRWDRKSTRSGSAR